MGAATTQERFAVLDGLRGVAAVCVVGVHLRGDLIEWLPSGHLAVDFFFLLSGFVLCHAYEERLQNRLGLVRFMTIRVVRLWPLYVFGTLAGFAAAAYQVWTGALGDSFAVLTRALAFNLLYLPALPDHEYLAFAPYPFNFQSWSLFFELVANLAFAIVLTRFKRTGVVTGAIVFAILLIVSVIRHGHANVGFSYDNFFDGIYRAGFTFFTGAILYWAFRHFKPAFKTPTWLVAIALVAIFTVRANDFMRPFYDLACIGALFPALVFFGATTQPGERVRRLCEISGDISYPLYALHIGVFNFLFAPVLSKFFGLEGYALPALWQITVIVALVGIAFIVGRYFDPPARAALKSLLLPARAPRALNKASETQGG